MNKNDIDPINPYPGVIQRYDALLAEMRTILIHARENAYIEGARQSAAGINKALALLGVKEG